MFHALWYSGAIPMLLIVAAIGSPILFINWINARHERVVDGITAIKAQLEKDKIERLYAKCSGLFARLLRQLDKLTDFPYDYKRVAYDVMEITHKGLAMTVAIRPEYASYDMGQFVAYNLPMGAGHGCENTLEDFARGVRNMFGWVLAHPTLVEEYHRRRAEHERRAA